MQKKASTRLRKLLEKNKAEEQELLNELSKFMVERKNNRHSVTLSEVKSFFDCSATKATRLLHGFVKSGRLTRDPNVETLYWLVVE